MKHIIYIIALIAIAATSVTSCRKAPINGHLDGQWQIMTVEYPVKPTLNPDRYYLCFYRHSANLRHYGNYNVGANLTYNQGTDSLTLEFPDKGEWLGNIGISHSTPYTARFHILKLTRKQLVMTLDDSICFTLRKF